MSVTNRSFVVLGAVTSLLAVGLVGATPLGALAAPGESEVQASCAAFDDSVYQVVKPKNEASLVTASSREATSAAKYGFTENRGTTFKASTKPGPGLVPVHRLYRWSVQDFLSTPDPTEVANADRGTGYEDQGVNYYVSTTPDDCLVPVYRFIKSGRHRLAVAQSDRDTLDDQGWTSEGVSFYAAPAADVTEPEPPVIPTAPDGEDTTFSFAVYPDTQQEVGKDSRFVNRSQWLADQESALDLRFVTHTGDVVNWDTPDHEQYEVASKAMLPLEKAGIPYSLAIGNHDTQATGVGGAARDPKRTRELQRDTSVFNDYFNAGRYGGVSGAYEKDKVDNVYSVYEAGGRTWMVLVLELWPRAGVVDWAKAVVASHPDANVVVVTHDYLDAGGSIEQSAGYGVTSPQELYNQLISQYANIKMVFSGHVGFAASRVDTGVKGNKIYSFVTAIHSGRSNPVRLVEIDTKADSLKTRIYCPWDDARFSQYDETISGADWVE